MQYLLRGKALRRRGEPSSRGNMVVVNIILGGHEEDLWGRAREVGPLTMTSSHDDSRCINSPAAIIIITLD